MISRLPPQGVPPRPTVVCARLASVRLRRPLLPFPDQATLDDDVVVVLSPLNLDGAEPASSAPSLVTSAGGLAAHGLNRRREIQGIEDRLAARRPKPWISSSPGQLDRCRASWAPGAAWTRGWRRHCGRAAADATILEKGRRVGEPMAGPADDRLRRICTPSARGCPSLPGDPDPSASSRLLGPTRPVRALPRAVRGRTTVSSHGSGIEATRIDRQDGHWSVPDHSRVSVRQRVVGGG